MKKLITICVGLIVAGCDNSGQLAEANAKIQDLEKRLARIEGDLYKIEVKSASKVEKQEVKKTAEPKFVPAKEVEKNVVDAKIEAFLKEYLGAEFGDSIDKFPGGNDNNYPGCCHKDIPMLKKFKYFDKGQVIFYNGKLYGMTIYAEIDRKYSLESTNKMTDQALADLVVTFGLASTALNDQNLHKHTSYVLCAISPDNDGHVGPRRRGLSITNQRLFEKLIDEVRRKETSGEDLPDPE